MKFFDCLHLCSERYQITTHSGDALLLYDRGQIDSGAFSTIHLVSASHGRKKYVLKRMKCYSKEDEVKVANEVKIHSELPPHPNILPCIGSCTKRLTSQFHGAICEIQLVLPFCQRGTVEQLLNYRRKTNHNGLSAELSAHIILGVCNALSVLLSMSTPLSHRDIKPGNVLLSDNMRPMLTDFGSCTTSVIKLSNYRDVEFWKDFATENCSMLYRAPELFQPQVDSSITEKADIWSLGCLFYATLFLESPMERVHARGDSVLLAACSPNFSFPVDSPSVPKAFIKLIKNMLSVEPETRPSVDSIRQELQETGYHPIDTVESAVTSRQPFRI